MEPYSVRDDDGTELLCHAADTIRLGALTELMTKVKGGFFFFQ